MAMMKVVVSQACRDSANDVSNIENLYRGTSETIAIIDSARRISKTEDSDIRTSEVIVFSERCQQHPRLKP
jgi:hypothetical protein